MLAAVTPLLLFIAGGLSVAYFRILDEKAYWPIALAAFALAVLTSRDRQKAAETALSGMTDRVVVMMIMAWLLAATLGQFLRAAEVVPELATLLIRLGATGGMFVAGTFVLSAVVATATGTAVGTILICTPLLFPLGAELGADPTILLGAILGGGAFGDDFSPLSDTTIASAETQNVPVRDAVLDRLRYIAIPALVAFVLFGVFGGTEAAGAAGTESIRQSVNASSLWMLLSPLAVLILSKNILHALLSGIVVAALVGLVTGITPPEVFFSIDPETSTATSIIIDGLNRGVGVSIISILLIGTVSIVINQPAMSRLLQENGIPLSPATAETRLASVTIGANLLLAHNTVAILATAPLALALRRRGGLTGLRTAQIVDISANTVMHFFPYMVTVIMAVALASADLARYGIEELNPFAVGFSNYHSLALLGMVVVVISTGLFRTREAGNTDREPAQ